LILLDLSGGKQRLACSVLAQVYNQVGTQTPDVDDSSLLKSGFLAIQKLLSKGVLQAYHDRSDGGLLASVVEMAFASRCGLELDLNGNDTALSALFNEELGAVLQVAAEDQTIFDSVIAEFDLSDHVRVIGKPTSGERVAISFNDELVLDASRVDLHRTWSKTSYQMQSLRDNPVCAEQEYDRLLDTADTGLSSSLSFDPKDNVVAPYIGGARPRVAILREQGVNGHIERCHHD